MIGLICLACFGMMIPSFLCGKYFVGGGDVKTQWYPFYELIKRSTLTSLEDKTLPFYSFILFLGNNIWASKTSYGLFDIYNIASYVINNNYFLVYDIQCFVKILVSGITFYSLINYIYKNKKVSFIGGLCYALSSYAIYFTSQPGFLSFYSLAPLYFLSIEKYINEKKIVSFPLIVFLLLLTNYYLFFALSIFTPAYYLYRYYNTNKNMNGVVLNAIKLIGLYVVGVLLSGIVIVPSFLYVIQNNRVGNDNIELIFDDLSIYLHLFISPFIPNQTYIYGNNAFDNNAHTLKEICLFSGSIISILVPQFINDEKKFKKSTLYLYLFIVLMLFIPFFSSMVNGFSGACFRWLFVFITINIIVACKYLNNIELINKKNLKITLLIESILVISCFVLCVIYKQFAISEYILQLVIILTSIVFLTINSFSILKNNRLWMIFTCIELVIFVLFYGYKSLESSVNKETIVGLTNVIADDDSIYNIRDYFNILDENNENEYYRIYVPYKTLYWDFSYDLSIIYNINGLMTYDSTYAPSFNKMVDIAKDKITESIDWQFNIDDNQILNFTSTKYSITNNEDEIPFANYEIVDDSYRGTLLVSLNKDYRPIGSTYSQSISYVDLKNKYSNDTSLLNEYVISDVNVDELLGNNHSVLTNVQYYNNYFYGEISSDDNTFMVLGLPYDKGWKISNNGEIIDYLECNGGMIGFPIKEGNNIIEMYFVPDGFKIGTICTGIGALAFVGLIIIELRKRKLS